MTNKADDRVELLQGTLDLIVLRALAMMGAQHAYGLAARLEQMADDPFALNQQLVHQACQAPPSCGLPFQGARAGFRDLVVAPRTTARPIRL